MFWVRRPEAASTPFHLKCSAEMNSACAEVLPAAKRSYGAKAPPRRAGPHILLASILFRCSKKKGLPYRKSFLFRFRRKKAAAPLLHMLGRSGAALRRGVRLGRPLARRLCAAPPCGAPEGAKRCFLCLLVQLEDRHERLRGQLDGPQGRIFFLPSFCFSSSFFFRVMSPP